MGSRGSNCRVGNAYKCLYIKVLTLFSIAHIMLLYQIRNEYRINQNIGTDY